MTRPSSPTSSPNYIVCGLYAQRTVCLSSLVPAHTRCSPIASRLGNSTASKPPPANKSISSTHPARDARKTCLDESRFYPQTRKNREGICMAWLARRNFAALFILLATSAPLHLHAQPRFDFDLPERPLADSLRSIGVTARIVIAFDPATVEGHRAPPLRGRYTAREALNRVLHGSGLRARVTAGGSFWIEAVAPPGPSPPQAQWSSQPKLTKNKSRTFMPF